MLEQEFRVCVREFPCDNVYVSQIGAVRIASMFGRYLSHLVLSVSACGLILALFYFVAFMFWMSSCNGPGTRSRAELFEDPEGSQQKNRVAILYNAFLKAKSVRNYQQGLKIYEEIIADYPTTGVAGEMPDELANFYKR